MTASDHESAGRERLSRKRCFIEAAIVSLLALLAFLRVAAIERPPLWDEMYYLLVAQSWLADGSFTIADGTYRRAALFTMLLGSVFTFFGEDFGVARRLPAFLGALWVGAVFIWCYHHIGRREAWVASVMLALAPGTLFLSQFVRFYTAQALFFFVGAVAFYALVMGRGTIGKQLLLLGLAILSFSFALNMQKTTLVGIAALAVWAGAVLAARWLNQAQDDVARRKRRWILFSIACAASAAILAFDVLAYYRSFRTGWADQTDFRAYHWLLSGEYPTLWALVPVLTLYAVVQRPRPAFFAACIFGVTFLLLSIAAQRAERFLYFVMPFLFILWAVALVSAYSWVRELASAAPLAALDLRLGRFSSAVIGVVLIGCAVGLLAISNHAFRKASQMLLGGPAYTEDGNLAYWWGQGQVDWAATSGTLLPIMQRVDVVLTSSSMPTLYYLGDFDIEVNRQFLRETRTQAEFSVGSQTGRPIVSRAESIGRVVDCYATGLLIVPTGKLGVLPEFDDATVALLDARATRVDLQAEWGITAFLWEHATTESPSGCESLRAMGITRPRVRQS